MRLCRLKMSEGISVPMKIVWFTGFGVSLQCLVIQLFLYAVLPSSRKLDQKILTQLTIARLGNIIFEYLVLVGHTYDPNVRDAIFALYMQTDAALICWMFVFTKNLYEKVILVFSLKKISFALVSVSIWLLTLPVGILCPLFLNKRDSNEFDIFYEVYAIVKFVILCMNLLFFCRIFYVAISRRNDRDLSGLLRTCLVSFNLVCITSLQVLITDLTSFFSENLVMLNQAFSIINSFQVFPITVIFVILSKPLDESLMNTIVLKLKALIFTDQSYV